MAMTDNIYRVLLETDVTHGDFLGWLNSLATGAGLEDNCILLQHMSDNSVDTPELVDDCLSAAAAGRAKMEAGYFGAGVAASAAHFAAGFWTNAIIAKFADSLFAADAASRAKFVDGIWEPAKLSFQPVMDAGEPSSFCAHFTIGAFPVGQTIQVAAGEVWTSANPVVGPRDFLGGAGAAADLASFVAAVNADATSAAVALDAAGDTALLVGKLPATVLAGVSSHANCVIAGINPLVAAVDKNRAEGTYTLDAGAVDTGFLAAGDEIMIGSVLGGAVPPRVKSLLCTTAGGAVRILATVVRTVRALGGNRYAICLADGGAVLAASDVIEWEVVW
jgi:hypothetical protein